MNVNFGNKESVIFDDTRNLFKQENLKESIDQINNGILKDIRLVHPNQQDIQDLKPILKQNQTEFVLKGIIQDSPLSETFFSNENINALQNSIRFNVYKQSNQVIEKQSHTQLLSIMRSIYLKNSNSSISQKNFLNHIHELNSYVSDYSIPQITSELKQYNGYIQKLENLPIPIDRPKYDNKSNFTYDISNLI